jgi:hypothetical protein
MVWFMWPRLTDPLLSVSTPGETTEVVKMTSALLLTIVAPTL